MFHAFAFSTLNNVYSERHYHLKCSFHYTIFMGLFIESVFL